MSDDTDLEKYIVPVFIVVYGESEHDAILYVENALDSTELVFEDGICSVEVLEHEIEPYT